MYGLQIRSGNFQRKENSLLFFLPGIEPQFTSFTAATALPALPSLRHRMTQSTMWLLAYWEALWYKSVRSVWRVYAPALISILFAA
jgi:hypothetical protein